MTLLNKVTAKMLEIEKELAEMRESKPFFKEFDNEKYTYYEALLKNWDNLKTLREQLKNGDWQ